MSEATLRVYGASDDLIEVEGPNFSEEFNPPYGEESDLTMSDGTVLTVKYGKDIKHDVDLFEEFAIWKITLKKQGPAFLSIDECFDEEGNPPSDIAHFKPEVDGACVHDEASKLTCPHCERLISITKCKCCGREVAEER